MEHMYSLARILLIWLLCLLSVFLHELGHALGYRISTGKAKWKVIAGSGPRMFGTSRYIFCLIPAGGYFIPDEEEGTKKAKMITLAGGPWNMKKFIAALLIVMVLLSAVSLAEEDMTADLSEGSRLIGLLITREDLSVYTGEAGVVLASCTQEGPESEIGYSFGDINGLRLICFIAPEESREGSSIISNVDDGISAVDFDMNEDGSSIKMEAKISFVPSQDDELFFYNPVLLAASGQVFAVPGDCMAVSAAMNPPGSYVGQTVRDERKHTENGTEITDTTVVSIQIQAVRKPLKIQLLQFSRTHELLESEEFLPGTVPEQIIPLPEADYLLLETGEEDPEGGVFIRREVFGRDMDYLNTLSCRDDGICLSHYHEILWGTDGSPGQ